MVRLSRDSPLTFVVYKAKYRGLDVAVKQFSLANDSKSSVPDWFMKEVTLQRYFLLSSPNSPFQPSRRTSSDLSFHWS